MSKPPTGIYKVAVEVLRPLAKLTTKPHWSGRENLPDDEPFILVFNHLTEYDIIVLVHFIADKGHAVRVLAKDSLFRIPVLASILRLAKMVPVQRGSSNAGDALKHAKLALAEGESVAIFPEGTLTTDPDGWPMKFKTGAARLALATGKPVIPVAHWGGRSIMHRWSNSFPLKRKDTWVMAGPAIDLSDLNQDENDFEAVKEATRRMEDAITQMVAQLRDEEAPLTRWDPKLSAYPPQNGKQ